MGRYVSLCCSTHPVWKYWPIGFLSAEMQSIMASNKENEIIQVENRVDLWIKEFVVGLGLCPFAKHVLDSESIRYKVSTARSDLELLVDFESELMLLQQNQELATTLLIIPRFLEDFDDYLELIDIAQHLLEDSQLIGVFQLASFHPHYQFAHTAPDASENYSNRSPYPIIHILRETQVKSAIEAFGDTSTIPAKNISALQKIDVETLLNLTNRSMPPINKPR